MENSFQTSFIPKKPIVQNNSTSRLKNRTSISVVVSVFIFITIILSAGGLFFYKDYLNKNKENLSTTLFKMRESFDNNTIVELETYDKRTGAIKKVLANHIVLSPLFELLNELTLPSIQYIEFNHNTLNNVFNVQISGVARDYRSIALQADVFNTSKGTLLKDIIFSNLTKNKNNYITFDLEFNVDPTLLSYSNNILKEQPKNFNSTNPISSVDVLDDIENPDQLLITDNMQ